MNYHMNRSAGECPDNVGIDVGPKQKEAIMFSAKVREKSIEMIKHMCVLRFFLVAVMVIILAAAAPKVWAEDNGEESSFEEANLFFELNDTDGDLGIHALIDGDAWKYLEIEDPRGRKMLNIFVRGRLRKQGLTEIFFESAEPSFDELDPKKFFRRFPEGEYEIEGITLEGDELENTALLTHVMPAPPENILVSEIEVAEGCDEDSLPVVEEPVIISWDPVTESHPELGKTGEMIEVVNYQVVVEEEESGLVFSVDLPPGVTEVEVPLGFTALSDEFKFEILVREASGNQTAVESCFVIDREI